MALNVSDEMLCSVIPVVVYWIYSGFFVILGDKLDKYKLHSKAEEDAQNITISKWTVIKNVLFQQTAQIGISVLLFANKGGKSIRKPNPPLYIIAVQFFVGMSVLHTWLYFTHRGFHTNKFLYKHIHSVHHKLTVPYAYGSLYTHPVYVEGLVDRIGAGLALFATGMTPRVAVFFFSLVTIRAMDVHTGVLFPYNILDFFFPITSACHDVHHQLYGIKANYGQFFTLWDKILGTYMPYSLEKRKEGGYNIVRPLKMD